MTARILAAIGLVLALGACEGVKKQLGLTKRVPDEFRVQARAPLSLPPNYNLRPPQPGVPRPQEGTVQQQAKRVVLGTSSGSPYAIQGTTALDTRSAGEKLLLARAGADQADPNIRRIVDRETDLFNDDDKAFLDFLVFWREDEPSGVVIDAGEEAKRLRENAALGKPVTEGETPTIKRRKKALFEGFLGIF